MPDDNNDDVQMLQANQAMLNVTWGGQNGELPDGVMFDSADDDVKRMASEAVSTGGIPGITAAEADFDDFIVDRYAANEATPFNRIFLRPKVPFGV